MGPRQPTTLLHSLRGPERLVRSCTDRHAPMIEQVRRPQQWFRQLWVVQRWTELDRYRKLEQRQSVHKSSRIFPAAHIRSYGAVALLFCTVRKDVRFHQTNMTIESSTGGNPWIEIPLTPAQVGLGGTNAPFSFCFWARSIYDLYPYNVPFTGGCLFVLGLQVFPILRTIDQSDQFYWSNQYLAKQQ